VLKLRRTVSACGMVGLLLASGGCAGTALSGPATPGTPFSAVSPAPGPLKKLATSVSSTFDQASQSLKKLGKPASTQPADPIALDTKAEPPDAPFYVALARLREQANHTPAAIDMYQRALRWDPKHLPAQLGLARLYDRQGQLRKACELYQQAAQDHPDEPTVYNDLGLCLARQGRLPEASAALTKAVALRPQHALYRNNLASVLVELGRIDEAYAQLAAVHGRAVAHYNLGYMLQRRGSKAMAVQQFELALAADPGLEAAQQWLTALESELSQSQLARAPQAPRAAQPAPSHAVQPPAAPSPSLVGHGALSEPAAPIPEDAEDQLLDSDWPPVEADVQLENSGPDAAPRRY